MSSDKFTFLFAPVDAVGHFNACIGIAGQLRDRGHKIVFATPIGWKGKLVPLGFTEEIYFIEDDDGAKVNNGEEKNENDWGQIVAKMAKAMASTSPLDNMEKIMYPMFKLAIRQRKLAEVHMKRIMEKVKPDVVIMDNTNHSPALLDSGIPWVLLISFNPLGISSQNVPPAISGYPTNGDRVLWKSFDEKRHEIFDGLFEDFKGWVKDQGGAEIVGNNFPFCLNFSPYANIYMYPIEMDYTMHRPNPPNFHRFDAFVRITEEKFEIPEQLQNGPGKLVYFSLGTIGCSELGLMRRLIGILAKSPNRFIVSKGPLADQIELPTNMWGAPSLPQTKVIHWLTWSSLMVEIIQ